VTSVILVSEATLTLGICRALRGERSFSPSLLLSFGLFRSGNGSLPASKLQHHTLKQLWINASGREIADEVRI
jgi:hypothetical protein